jgi:uncharacterized protein YkwD
MAFSAGMLTPARSWSSMSEITRNIHTDYSPDPREEFSKQVLDYINEMRQNPADFYHRYVRAYVRQHADRFTDYYTQSLKKDLLGSPSLPVFHPDPTLKQCAWRQTKYLAGLGGRTLTHDQGNKSFAVRMKEAGLHCLAENLYTAQKLTPLQVVLDLLIDQRISSFGHRKNLMNPQYDRIGIVSKTTPSGYTLVVMDFGCAFR